VQGRLEERERNEQKLRSIILAQNLTVVWKWPFNRFLYHAAVGFGVKKNVCKKWFSRQTFLTKVGLVFRCGNISCCIIPCRGGGGEWLSWEGSWARGWELRLFVLRGERVTVTSGVWLSLKLSCFSLQWLYRLGYYCVLSGDTSYSLHLLHQIWT